MAPETPKGGVSSRLLSMKFMQRAAASGSSAGSPSSDVPSSKKRKLGHEPSDAKLSVDIGQQAVQAAIEEREAKRQAALAKHSLGDTQWTLDAPITTSKSKTSGDGRLKVVYVGYGNIDANGDDSENDEVPQAGRTSTRNYKDSATKSNGAPKDDDSDDEDSAEESDGQDSTRKARSSNNSPYSRPNSSTPSRSQSRPRSEDQRAKEFRDKRKKKEVKLGKLTSISSGGNASFGAQGSPSAKSLTCFTCNQPGHKASDCPNKGSRGSQKR